MRSHEGPFAAGAFAAFSPVPPASRLERRHQAAALILRLSAALIAIASAAVASSGVTPVDQALPLLAGVIVVLAWRSGDDSIALAVPLLLVIELSVVEERARLLLFGVVMTGAFAAALLRKCDRYSFVFAALVVLRWIPLSEVVVWRELLLMSATMLLVMSQRQRSAPATVSAVLLALALPVASVRFLTAPFGLAALRPVRWPAAGLLIVAAFFSRPALAEICLLGALALIAESMRNLTLQLVVLLPAAVVMTLFAWSGVVARGPLYFVKVPEARERIPVGIALRSGQSQTLAVPDGARTIVLTAANASSLRPGTILGTLEPGGRLIRVGDVSDWGYMRSGQWLLTGNRLPSRPAGRVRGYGQNAWVDGAGAIELPEGAREVTLSTPRSQPKTVLLQIEGFE